jgi:uncharacterized protein (TIGR04222 family)
MALLSLGKQAALGSALASLLHESKITLEGECVRVAPPEPDPERLPEGAAYRSSARPARSGHTPELPWIERTLLEHVAEGGEEGVQLRQLTQDVTSLNIPLRYAEEELVDQGLLRNSARQRWISWLVKAPLFAVLALGGVHIMRGVAYHRPVLFLVVLMLITVVITAQRMLKSTRAASGTATLNAARGSYAAIESTAKFEPKQLDGSELAMALALYGESALSGDFAPLQSFFAVPEEVKPRFWLGVASAAANSRSWSCSSRRGGRGG